MNIYVNKSQIVALFEPLKPSEKGRDRDPDCLLQTRTFPFWTVMYTVDSCFLEHFVSLDHLDYGAHDCWDYDWDSDHSLNLETMTDKMFSCGYITPSTSVIILAADADPFTPEHKVIVISSFWLRSTSP